MRFQTCMKMSQPPILPNTIVRACVWVFKIKPFFVCFLQKNHKIFYGVGKWFLGFRSRFEFQVNTNKLLRLDKSYIYETKSFSERSSYFVKIAN